MSDDPTDVRSVRTGLFVVDDLRARVGPCSTITEAEALSLRIMTCAEFEHADTPEPPGWWLRWRDALTAQWRRVTPDELAGQVALTRMRGPEASPMAEQDKAELHARVIALLDLRAAAPPPRPVAHLLTLEESIAGRWLRRNEVLHRDGRYWTRPLLPDPITGNPGQMKDRPAPPPTPNSWRRRRHTPPGAVELTADLLREHAALHPDLLQHGERPDWERVVEEIHKLVGG